MEVAIKIVEAYAVNILIAIIILVVGMWVAKLITKSVGKVLKKKEMDETLVKFMTSIVKTLLYAFVIIAAIDKAGIESTSIVAILGAAGLAVGLALQDHYQISRLE